MRVVFDNSVIAGADGTWLCRSILFVDGVQQGVRTTPLRDVGLTSAPAAWRATEAALLRDYAEGQC